MPGRILNAGQKGIIEAPLTGSLFIEGPAKTGKTTAAIYRLDKLLSEFPGYQILIIVPQQSLAEPYRQFIREDREHQGSIPFLTTISGLSKELVRKFWPIISKKAGFSSPNRNPVFLSLETAQYCMARIVDPLLEKGFFQAVTIERNRLFSQIIDNLNKVAIHGLEINDISARLISSSSGPDLLVNSFRQVQECAYLFRRFCLENNLVDYSLLMQISRDILYQQELCKKYIFTRFKVLYADNIEEDTPISHYFLRQWIGTFQSSTLLYDHDGGFRTFLGADAESAYQLRAHCDHNFSLDKVIKEPKELRNFRVALTRCISKENNSDSIYRLPKNSELNIYQFLPEMIDSVSAKIKSLIQNGIHPENIAILSPYLSDSMKFSLVQNLSTRNIPTITSRPSRIYISSPAVKTLLTFAKIAHPEWAIPVSHYSFRESIMHLIPGFDIVRAEHAAKALFPEYSGTPQMRSFDAITNVVLQETITFAIGEKLEKLFQWVEDYKKDDPFPLDIFIQRLFGELLSQPGFTLSDDFDAANDIEKLIQSIRTFRTFSKEVFNFDASALGKEYLRSIDSGLIPSSFRSLPKNEPGVTIAPAFTFLMQNRSVDFQFWLDIGSLGWWERLYQPLTNPYVYQSKWKGGQVWSQENDYEINQSVMERLIGGLLLRCNQGIFASMLQTNEFGAQNFGPLLQAFQTFMKRSRGYANHV